MLVPAVHSRASAAPSSSFLLLGESPLLLLPLLAPLPGLLHPCATGLGLVLQHLGPGLLSLLLVDVLHEDTLVLEDVTLGLEVKLVVQMSVDLLGLPISLQQAS